MASIFDSTVKFNGEVVIRAIENLKSSTNIKIVPYLKRNVNKDLMASFPREGGGNKATILISGDLGGTAQNYDGATTIVPTAVKNLSQTVIVIGRVHSWKEKDFVLSIAGKSELDSQVWQVATALDKDVKASAISILTALFDSSNGVLKARTLGLTADPTGTELNDAVTLACGDLAEGEFDVVIMDSWIANAYANLKLLQFAKYTNEQGLEMTSNSIAFLGNKLVVVDDAVGLNSRVGTHNMYAFGFRSFIYGEGLVKYPFEWSRDSLTAGGVDMFIARQRYVLAPYGIDFVGTPTTASPTEVELATATNWALVQDAGGTSINLKIIPFAHAQFVLS